MKTCAKQNVIIHPLALSRRTGSRRAPSGEDTAGGGGSTGTPRRARPCALDGLGATSSTSVFATAKQNSGRGKLLRRIHREPPGTTCPSAGWGGLCALCPRCHTPGVRRPAARPSPLRSGALFPSEVTATLRRQDSRHPAGPQVPTALLPMRRCLCLTSLPPCWVSPTSSLPPISPQAQPPPAAHPPMLLPGGGHDSSPGKGWVHLSLRLALALATLCPGESFKKQWGLPPGLGSRCPC